MLTLFYGTDRKGVRDAASEYVIKYKLPEDQVTTIDENNFEAGQLNAALGANSLFGGKEFFVIETPSSDQLFADMVLELLPELQSSTNHFILIEGSLLAPAKKKYTKYTEHIAEFKAETASRFDTFALAGALANKDKKNLWVLLQQAKAAGLRDEEIIGVLWWQLKTLRLAACTSSSVEAGVKEYPYKKAKQALKNFQPGELEKKSTELLTVYHEGHQGITDLSLGLEAWLLKV